MKRRYDSAFYRALVAKVDQTAPDVAVGVDVMVGFPGESEEAFTRTLELLRDLPLAYLHVFPYSERPGTAALAIEPKVLPAVKKERAAILRRLGMEKREGFARRFLGRTLPVLVEQARDKKTGLARGFSHNYLPVVLDKAPGSLVNSIRSVKIEEYRENRLTGRLIDG
jgi:threonylcarbamoyladenosine tRNA methylthiotransferase MtaB